LHCIITPWYICESLWYWINNSVNNNFSGGHLISAVGGFGYLLYSSYSSMHMVKVKPNSF